MVARFNQGHPRLAAELIVAVVHRRRAVVRLIAVMVEDD